MTIMKKNIFLLAVTLLLIGFASCSDEDTKPIIPSDVIDLSADTQDKPGYIVLRWATPDDNTIKAVSEPAPVQVVFGESKQIALTVDQLSTNAQEKSEGPIANLIDGNTASYFHTSWSGTVPPAPHWFQIDTKKEITYFKYESVARNGNNIPDDVDIMGSNDGVNFELIENLTKAKNGMLMSTSPYTSPVMGNNSKPYRYIRYSVNHTNTGSVFFSMSEFKLFEVDASVVDPEAD